MKRRLLILALLSAPSAWAQKAPVYDCWVLEADGGDYVTVGIARDSVMIYKNRYPTPAGLDALKTLCRTQIATLTAKDAAPIAVGKVDLTPTIVTPPPPPPPTPDDVKRGLFIDALNSLNGLKVKRAALVQLGVATTAVDTAIATLIGKMKTALAADPNLYDDLLGNLQ